jgi:hypothetical protein
MAEMIQIARDLRSRFGYLALRAMQTAQPEHKLSRWAASDNHATRMEDKMNSVQILAAGFALSLVPHMTLAADGPKPDAPELADYERTGQRETCLRAHDIDQTQILNRHQVLLRLTNGRFYLGEMPDCPQLSRSMTLVYDATPNDLCTTTIVHIADFAGPASQRGACGFSSFELLKKKPKG